jgi:hypothetical protein
VKVLPVKTTGDNYGGTASLKVLLLIPAIFRWGATMKQYALTTRPLQAASVFFIEIQSDSSIPQHM